MSLKTKCVIFTILLPIFGSQAYAYESLGLSAEQQECFSYAMIGMDSVINSRLGLPPEHALDIARVNNYRVPDNTFDNAILNVMLDAYLWKTSPHSYALKVFFDCASRGASRQQQAKY